MSIVMFNRKTFFDSVRKSLFGGVLTQQQVDGMDFKLNQWEAHPYHPTDLRWLAYPFATSYHETGAKMWPVEEGGKGSGKPYGKKDPETKQTYYGRGDVQLTWRDNYKRATRELGLQSTPDDLEWHATKALDPKISADVMFMGMREGWFRKSKEGKPQTLLRYFSTTKNDPYEAREIINGDKTIVPKWSGGVSIGNLIKNYHNKFFVALEDSLIDLPGPELPPEIELPEVVEQGEVYFAVTAKNAKLIIEVNGEVVFTYIPMPTVTVDSMSVTKAFEAVEEAQIDAQAEAREHIEQAVDEWNGDPKPDEEEDINPHVPEPEIGDKQP